MPARTGTLSRRAREELLEAISSGAYPDDRLPPESQLAVDLGVSRTTLRAALQSLADDGILNRRRRHGTSINRGLLRHQLRLNRLISFTALIEQSGHVPSVDAQHQRVTGAGPRTAAALGVDAGAPCLLVERLLRADGRPVIAVADTVSLTRLGRDPAEVEPADSTFAFLERNGLGTAEYATSEIVPRVAAPGTPAGLVIEPGAPYVELVETVFAAAHEPVAVSHVAVDDRLVRLSLLRRDV